MAEHRPFPPSPRRRALARRAGLHAASPWITGGVAAGAALLAVGAVGRLALHRLGDAIVAACHAGAQPTPDAALSALPLASLPQAILGLALPLLAAAALAALLAQLAQTRAAWLPRRRFDGAPALDAGSGPRVRRASGDLAAGTVLATVAFGWLWWTAPRIASLLAIDPIARAPSLAAPLDRGAAAMHGDVLAASPLLAGAVALLVSLAVAVTVAWLALGVLDALARHAALARALAMTSTQKREDDRLAGADPRWRAHRAAVQRGPRLAEAVAGASVLVLGDDAAVAVAWDPRHRPVPVRTASARGPRARQLLGLARRHRIAVHRDAALAVALVDGDGPVPEPHWPRLAEIIAATRARASDSGAR